MFAITFGASACTFGVLKNVMQKTADTDRKIAMKNVLVIIALLITIDLGGIFTVG